MWVCSLLAALHLHPSVHFPVLAENNHLWHTQEGTKHKISPGTAAYFPNFKKEIRARHILYEDLPLPEAIQRPENSPLPPSGIPPAPWAGLPTIDVPMINSYELAPKEHYRGHLEELDALTPDEAFSGFLDPQTDAQHYGDLSDPYFVPTSGWGNLLGQIVPFRRKLQKKGITFTIAYKGEFLGNFKGGMRQGADYINKMDYNFNFDLGKLFGFRNWAIHMVVMDKAGRELSRDHIGEYNIALQQSMGYTGNKAFHLADLYAQKILFEDRLNIAFGRMALSHIFGESSLLCTFMTTCSVPAALKEDPGLAEYPKGTWGARAKFRPTRDTHFIIGAYQVSPPQDDPSGWTWGGEHTTGLSLPIQFTWTPFLTRNRLAGHYKLGFMHDTSSYQDIFYAKGSLQKITHQTQHVQHNHDREDMNVFWFEMDQMMYRLGGRNEMAGGYILSGFIHNTPHVSTIDDQAYGGVSLNGIIKNRPTDRLGILYSWYHISRRKQLGEAALIAAAHNNDLATAMVLGDAYGHFGTLGPQVKGRQSSTHIIEAYYSIDAAPGLLVQPEFIYQIRPGETTHIPNAAMLGMKVIGNL